jgi:hypothetical protein
MSLIRSEVLLCRCPETLSIITDDIKIKQFFSSDEDNKCFYMINANINNCTENILVCECTRGRFVQCLCCDTIYPSCPGSTCFSNKELPIFEARDLIGKNYIKRYQIQKLISNKSKIISELPSEYYDKN